MIGLTPTQSKLLSFLCWYQGKHGYAPCFDEMRVALGLVDKGGIHRMLCGLEERGSIRRLRQRVRAIEILNVPDKLVDWRPAPGIIHQTDDRLVACTRLQFIGLQHIGTSQRAQIGRAA